MARDPEVSVFEIGEVPIAIVNTKGMIASIKRYLAMGRDAPGAFVAFCNAHGIIESQDNRAVLKAHQAAWLTVADGRSLFFLGRLLGRRKMAQVPGIEAMEAVCRAGVAAGWGHYFLGGRDGVAEKLAEELRRRVPGLRVVGCHTPPFRPLTASEIEAMREDVRASGAHVAWIGLGAPKQELFMAEHAAHLPGVIAMGVGAAFDFNTGGMPHAPRIVRFLGGEWAYRIALEPRRLLPRYAVAGPRFIAMALKMVVRSLVESVTWRRPVSASLPFHRDPSASP